MFYNPFNQIERLNRVVKNRDCEIEGLKKRILDLTTEREETKHKPDETCRGCKNYIRAENGYSGYVMHFCKLDNHCADYEEE